MAARDEELIGTAEAAEELQVDRSTLRRWINEGRVEARRVGRQWRVRRSDLAKLIEVKEPAGDKGAAAVGQEMFKRGEQALEASLGGGQARESELFGEIAAVEKRVVRDVADSDPQSRRLVARVLLQAVFDRASDVHIEPAARDVKMRYRVDGVLHGMQPLPSELGRPVVDELMRWAKLDLKHRHLPQDGRILLECVGREIDFRVSTLPGIHGNIVCLRVLDRGVALPPLDGLGLEPPQLKRYREFLTRRNGAIVVTGPTGAGKTTTIYASLLTLNKVDTKIVTAEDPVEFDLDGIDQVAIRPAFGLDFTQALRSMLRQAPDVLFAGEMRSRDVAQIICQASLTGHLVFSTLHAGDAPGALQRMVDMGCAPFVVVDSVNAVLSQRLVRLVCTGCRAEAKLTSAEIEALGLDGADAKRPVYRGTGCDQCNGTGYRGRTAIYELLEVQRDMLKAIASDERLRLEQAARASGWRPLREVALDKIFRGDTTVEEVVSVM